MDINKVYKELSKGVLPKDYVLVGVNIVEYGDVLVRLTPTTPNKLGKDKVTDDIEMVTD